MISPSAFSRSRIRCLVTRSCGSALMGALAWGLLSESSPAVLRLAQAEAAVPETAQEIIAEALRPNHTPLGRPLPLAAFWESGDYDFYWNDRPGTYNTPVQQMQWIEEGRHILPTLRIPSDPAASDDLHSYYDGAWDTFAEWGMPVTLKFTQWECVLSFDPKYYDLPPSENPNVIALDGVTIQRRVDPMGPVGPWYQAGLDWTMGTTRVCPTCTDVNHANGWLDLQDRYPNPPLLIMLSNNEHPKLTSLNEETSKRWVDAYGTSQTGDFVRETMINGYATRYEELFRGLGDGLRNASWQQSAKFVGYDVLATRHFGRWDGWKDYSWYYPNNLTAEAEFWDGGSPSYYLDSWNSITDFTVYSPQIEYMNVVFMLEEAQSKNPDFWFELSVWDGFENSTDPTQNKRAWYESIGQSFTPARYKAYTQFGMWLLKPRAVREFRGWTQSHEEYGIEYTEAFLDAVDAVYDDPLLTRFWREGKLVPNREHDHPYQSDIPPEYAGVDRWFLLDTDLDPPRPWALDTELPVFALANVIGNAPNREWLVYAYSPVRDRFGVSITIPGYGDIVMDVPQGGAFQHVVESPTQPAANEPPSVPSGLMASAVAPTEVDLSWTPSTDADGTVTHYILRRDGAQIATPSGISYADTSLAAETKYSYTVEAVDDGGAVSGESAAVSTATPSAPNQPPSVPTGVAATAQSQTEVEVTWTASSDPDGTVAHYIIRRDGAQIATTGGTSYLDGGVQADTTYAYTVEAVDDEGAGSGESQVANATTPALPPTVTLAASLSSINAGESTTLTWSSSNATTCTGSGFSTGGSTSGSLSVSPSATTIYSVTCTGRGGSASAEVTVSVSPAKGLKKGKGKGHNNG